MSMNVWSQQQQAVFLVLHGGSESSRKGCLAAIDHQAVTLKLIGLHYAQLTCIRDYVLNKKDFIMKPIG